MLWTHLQMLLAALLAPAGRKATMASEKVWEFGEMSLYMARDAVDYGQATAMTRMGSVGE